MKLVSLSLRQWRTFEECDLEFPDGLIGIRGPNGAGKTTIAEAIGWALFGKIRAGGRLDDLRRQDAPKGAPSSVELVFRMGSTLFRVERVVRGSAKLWVGSSTTPETTQTRATNARIALELDMNWDVFHRTVFARQKDVAALDPAGSADSRRRHVERLLGLERYRAAAEKARADARSIADELVGRRADAPDVRTLDAELVAAEQHAADSDPFVAEAETNAKAAREAYDALVAAVDTEGERAQEHTRLEAERNQQRQTAESAEADEASLRVLAAEHSTKEARLAEISDEAAGASEAERRAKLWNDLAQATTELEAAGSALEQVVYDEAGDAETRARVAALIAERESDQRRQGELTSRSEALDRRLDALATAAAAGPINTARASVDTARKEHDQVRGRLSIVRHQLEEDRSHVAAVSEGGGDTPCPICLRPYGAEHATILAKHRGRIAEHEDEIGVLERRDSELADQVAALDDVLRTAERAAEGLASTDGPDEEAAAAEERALAASDLEELEKRLTAAHNELAVLNEAVASHAQARETWSSQEAVRSDRAARATRLLEELAVTRYQHEQHTAITADAERLAGLASELQRLTNEVAAGRDADEKRSQAEARARDARAAEASATAALEALAFDPEGLPNLREQREAAQAACDLAVTALAEATAAAQAQNESVKSLRERLDQARVVQSAIGERSLEHDRHKVAAELLTEFRSHQSQRAWPHLEQGASAILSAATDGRYADVRLSDDFRIVVVDRGEEHELSRFSGGEQDVTNLCLRLAIAEWVARERGAEINFVVLDEVFGSQDDDRRQLLLGELRALGNRFQQLLVITHLGDLADLCEHLIEVRLEEPGRSSACFKSE